MKREGKFGPFIPCEVRAQMEPARATTPAVARRRRRATTAVGAQAKAYPLRRRRLRLGDNACAQERTHACGQRRVPRGRSVFSQTPQTSALGRQHMCPSDNVCARAMTGAAWEGCFFTNTLNFSARAMTSASGDNACVRAMTFALAR